MSHLKPLYQVGTQPITVAIQGLGPEDDFWHFGARKSQFLPSNGKYAYHKQAGLFAGITGCGLVPSMVAPMIKGCDHHYTTDVMGYFPGIKYDGGDCSWVSAPIVRSLKTVQYLVGTTTMFQTSGDAILSLMELMGKLADFSEMIGLSKSPAHAIRQSKRNRILMTPIWAFPFSQDKTNRVYNAGSVLYHGVSVQMAACPVDQMIMYHGCTKTDSQLVRTICDNKEITSAGVEFALYYNGIWVSKEERAILGPDYRETFYKEFTPVGSMCVKAADNTASVPLSVKGPVCYFVINIRSASDLTANNWTRLCAASGEDYLIGADLMIDRVARNDSLPAFALRTKNIIETFKHKISRNQYVDSFETDDTKEQFNGQQNFSNVDSLAYNLRFNAHTDDLYVDVYAAIVQGWWTEAGATGRSYAYQGQQLAWNQ
jgi:hypothetical protein